MERVLRTNVPALIPSRRGAKKGHEKHGGRVKGTPNAVHAELKECILQAGHDVGELRYVKLPRRLKDRKPRYKRIVDGLDGLTGYIRYLAIEHPTIYGALLGRVLPLQVLAQFRGELEVRHYQSVEDVRQSMRERGVPVEKLEQALLTTTNTIGEEVNGQRKQQVTDTDA